MSRRRTPDDEELSSLLFPNGPESTDDLLVPPTGMRRQLRWRKARDARRNAEAKEDARRSKAEAEDAKRTRAIEKASALCPEYRDAYLGLSSILPATIEAVERGDPEDEVLDLVPEDPGAAKSRLRMERAVKALMAAMREVPPQGRNREPASPRPPTAAANAARRAGMLERAKKAQQMKAEGKRVPAIAKEIDRSERRVRSLLKVPLDRK